MADLPLLPIESADKNYDSHFGKDAQELSMQLGISRREHRRDMILGALASSLVTALILTGLAWALIRPEADRPAPFKYDNYFSIASPRAEGCGTTVEEAVSKGCLFDALSDLWLPPRCSRKYEAEYLRSNNGGPFHYWSDRTGKHEITDRSRYASTYYSTTRDHLKHCEFWFYRIADSLETGQLVGHAEAFSGHVHHCAMVLSKFAYLAPGLDHIAVDTDSAFGVC